MGDKAMPDIKAVHMVDVTVRIPVYFPSPQHNAGFVERAVNKAMEENGWTGGCAVIWRDIDGKLYMHADMIGPPDLYEGVLPHEVE